MAGLFQQIDSPAQHAHFSKKHGVRWYAWSTEFEVNIPMFKKQLNSMPGPDLVYLKKYKEYNYSYSYPISTIDKALLRDFRQFALSLYYFDPGSHLNFFTGLINARISGLCYQKLLALMRTVLVHHTKDQMAALYSPLSAGKDQSDFPLHCDLYIPDILFNVFDKVAVDGSGRCTFLRLDTFFSLIEGFVTMPPAIKEHIRNIFTLELKSDYYETFYGLLHGEENGWRQELQKALAKAKIGIRLTRGQGYMINDRIWMHGRDKTNGGISTRRLHRLIYKNDLS